MKTFKTFKKFPIVGILVLVAFLAVGVNSIYSSPLLQNGDDRTVFIPVITGAQPQTSVPVFANHDAYVKSQQPQNNYGSDKNLQIRVASDNNNYYSYLKFTVNNAEGSITSARLQLYVTDGSDESVSIHLVSNNYRDSNEPWTEAGLDWSNAPTIGNAQSVATGPVAENSWLELDLTSVVVGNGTYSFALVNASNDSIYYNSSEANNRQPVLRVSFDGESGPVVTPTPTAVPTEVTPSPTAVPPTPTSTPGSPPAAGEMWISSATLASLPTSGTAWNNLWNAAQQSTTSPNVGDQNDTTDVYVLAKALVYARTGQTQYRTEVMAAIVAAMGTESGAGILGPARNIQAYVIAADLINLESVDSQLNSVFSQWLSSIRHVVFDGAGPSLSIISCHESRPNNFGTHCGASRIAIALYLNDTADLQAAANVFKGWLGDRDAYSDFSYGELDWQCDSSAPVGINPVGCTRNGQSIDGVLPDDQRRSGDFSWPPAQENYVWEALQGAIVQAELLTRVGYPAWQWQDKALLRAINWLHEEANYPAGGDDSWQPWLFNYAYGSNFPAPSSSSPGKGMGWTDWTHGQQ